MLSIYLQSNYCRALRSESYLFNSYYFKAFIALRNLSAPYVFKFKKLQISDLGLEENAFEAKIGGSLS